MREEDWTRTRRRPCCRGGRSAEPWSRAHGLRSFDRGAGRCHM